MTHNRNASAAAAHRLCIVVHRTLHHFAVLKEINSTPEIQKQLLISLSQIIRDIRHWIDNQDTEDEIQHSSCPIIELHSTEHDCLANLVSVLISLLNTDSKYVQHLVSNIFLVTSEFLLACGDSWDKLIRLLCASFEIGLCNVLQPSFDGVENSKSIAENLSLVLNDFTWNGVSGIIRVLRGILKQLKEEDYIELVVIASELLTTSLLKIPWVALNGVQNDTKTDGDYEVKIMLVGNLVQLLCSLVELIGSDEVGTGSFDKISILHKICDLIPKLVQQCLAEEQYRIHSRIRGYFQHKFLMLMIRLSFHLQLDCSILLLWLELLHKHFQHLLSRPLSVVQCGQDDPLEGSPFLSSFQYEEENHLSSRHLQTQAVFLFVRCCCSLIDHSYSSVLTASSKRTSTLFDSDLKKIDIDFARKKGLLELYEWLQGKLPHDIFSNNQMNLEKSFIFTSSFITLYMNEDDMLFEVLLLLLSLSSWRETMVSKDGGACDNEEDILFLVSYLFNPLLVFHVFLAELRYDHQLLLDFLISKDTGSKCAEYLLRCLRMICVQPWDLFLQPTHVRQSNCQKSYKRTRTFLEDSCAEKNADPSCCAHAALLEQYDKKYRPGSKVFGKCNIRLQDAKACLLLLKTALNKLHQKKLFPYNPDVLIRCITRFEVLYDQQVKGGGS